MVDIDLKKHASGLHNRKWLLLIVLVLAVAWVSGCSSGSKNSNSEAKHTLSGAAPMADRGEDYSTASPQETVAASDSDQALTPQEAAMQSEVRKLIYTAHLDMQVADYAASAEQIRQTVDQMGGYVLTFNEHRSEQAPSGEWEIRIPADRFTTFIDQLDDFPALRYDKRVQGEDVTEQYVDLSSRLKAKLTVEERLIGFMEAATDSEALLNFSNQLAEVQVEVEQIKGKLRYLDNHVDFSTVHINLYQRADGLHVQQSGYSFVERIERAFIGSAQFVWRAVQGIAVFVIGAVPIILPLAIIAVPLIVYLRRKKR